MKIIYDKVRGKTYLKRKKYSIMSDIDYNIMNDTGLPTHTEVVKYSENVKKNITDVVQFLYDNCYLVHKKNPKYFVKTDELLIKNSKSKFAYCPPEVLEEYINRISFYVALKELNVPEKLWF